MDSLPVLYLGYGVIGGIGLGIGYISPGLDADQVVPGPARASRPGMAIMGFGGGALIASPLSTKLMSVFDPGFDSTDTTAARRQPGADAAPS